LVFLVFSDTLLGSSHVGDGRWVGRLDCGVVDLVAVFPVWIFDAQAQVNDGLCWTSGDTRGAVEIHLLLLVVDEIEENLGSLEETLHVLSLVEVI